MTKRKLKVAELIPFLHEQIHTLKARDETVNFIYQKMMMDI